ncbi:hypothetical protein [Rhodopirellula sp. SWK7]|uniref:hypothetical protein n=1 Tax=Rhodopirellula sp. SWK7 TaxID=595460 RepID=UPI0002BD9BE3|nr:hypothetical protein [Rhodopirellula sp. SWK7]EMI46147.1 hypothetical protein RRSWK_01332 [Rhodopirellula sp. SWK7]
MPEYNNAAGRILAVLENLQPHSGKNCQLAQLGEAFGVDANWRSVLVAIQDVTDEFSSLCDEIEQFEHNTAKYNLYKKNLPDIEKSIESFTLNMPAKNCVCQISQPGVVALRFIAADLTQDAEPEDNEIEALRSLVNELQAEIENSDVFSKSVREWLLDLVRVIRDSIDRFAIRGSRGMRKQFSLLLGELIQNYDIAQKVQEKKPSVWERFTSAIDLMNKLASLAEHCRPAVTFAQKSLPLLRTLGLPAPDDFPVDDQS